MLLQHRVSLCSWSSGTSLWLGLLRIKLLKYTVITSLKISNRHIFQTLCSLHGVYQSPQGSPPPSTPIFGCQSQSKAEWHPTTTPNGWSPSDWQDAAFTWCPACCEPCKLLGNPHEMDDECIHFQFTDGKMREDGHPGTPREHTWGCCSGYREMLLCSLSLVHPTGAAHPTPMQSRNDTDRVRWECQCSSHQQHIEAREGICVWSCVTLLSEMHFPSPHSGNRKSGTCWHIRTMGKNLGNSTEMLLKSKGKADTVLRQGD